MYKWGAVWLLKELITFGERRYACSNNWSCTVPIIICTVQSLKCYFSCYCINLVIGAHNCQVMEIGLMHTNLVLLYLAVMHHFAVWPHCWEPGTLMLLQYILQFWDILSVQCWGSPAIVCNCYRSQHPQQTRYTVFKEEPLIVSW
jgi:hypothetical protein